MTVLKTEFLAVCDYGQGGLWIRVVARDRDEIAQKYPFLTVVDIRPDWMSADDYNRTETLDIEQPPTGWVAQAVEEQK